MVRRAGGFSLLEVLLGFFVLAVAFVSLGAYVSSQRGGLNRAGRLSDGTHVAVSVLEAQKALLADSAAFRALFDQAAFVPRTTSLERTVNHVRYGVAVTVSRAPAPLYALKVRARVSWTGSRAVELGVMVPGATGVL